MATINFATREITLKLVYFGAAGAGCTTTVEHLWAGLDGRERSAMHRFGPRETDARSWYFETIAPHGGPLEGFRVVWRIYSLPGAITLPLHRKEVFKGADGTVFVVDARPDRAQANLEQFLSVETALTGSAGQGPVPVVFQVNHTDHPDALRADQAVVDLNPFGYPVVDSVARDGLGVMKAHVRMSSLLGERVAATFRGNDSLEVTAVHAPRPSAADVVRAHLATIQSASAEAPTLELQCEAPRATDADSIEVAFQPRAFVGSHPVGVVQAVVEGGRIRVDLEMERMGGGSRRPLTVLLANRPPDTPPVPQVSPPVPAETGSNHDRVFDYLPAGEPAQLGRLWDLPPSSYGIVGVAAGVLIGLLAGYLLGFIL